MKKFALFTALLALGFAVTAQTLNVQSAMTDLKRGYLKKAKTSIDKACEHPDTKDDAKTWYYAGLIYSRIGNEAGNSKSKNKDIDPEWAEKAYNAALRCKELDKTGEYDLKYIFGMIGTDYYNKSIPLFNEGKYQEALNLSDKAVMVFNNSGDKDQANEALFIAGYCCQMLKDNDGVKKYYGPLVRKSTFSNEFKARMPHVYQVMYGVYIEAKDTANVVKTAERYTKAMPEDPQANIMLANAYVWMGNTKKGMELADKAVEESKNDQPKYVKILCAAAGIHEMAGDYATAEQMYKTSSELEANQFEANYGMGSMMNNRAADKSDAINKMVEAGKYSEEDQAVMDKLTEERNEYLRKAIPYLTSAIAYIDALNPDDAAQYRPQLHSCLKALNACYVTLEMYDQSKPIKARIEQLEKGN